VIERAPDSIPDPAAVVAATRAMGVVHGVGADEHDFFIDAVPRLLTRAEFDRLAQGVVQRTAALEAFVADVHGDRHAVRDGVVPADLLDDCPWAEPGLPAVRQWVGMGGPDVIRDEDGQLACLEDNVRTPTMLAYAIACARAVRGDEAADALAAEARGLVHAMLAHAAGTEAPRAVLLGDGARSVVRWELGELAALAGVPLVEEDDLVADGDELRTRDGERVDVVWRRTSEERLEPFAGLLERPLRAGTVAVVNAFGAGVADDKRTYAYVEDLVRYFLGEEPLLRSVPTWDLANPEHRAAAEDALPELVVKPRGGSGGYGVLIRPDRLPDDAERCIAQRPVDLSQHPTVNAAGELEPRHVDLRPYVFRTAQGFRVLHGAFSRVAARPNDLIVNCSQGGGGKDVWIVD
jgi:uncharacterized circularly permuted ATP-grasp superfamily protein